MRATKQSSCKKICFVSACVICEKYFLPEIQHKRNAVPARSCSVRSVCVFYQCAATRTFYYGPLNIYIRTCRRSCKTLRLCGCAKAYISMCLGFENNLSMCDARLYGMCLWFIWRIWDYRSSCRFNVQRSVM